MHQVMMVFTAKVTEKSLRRFDLSNYLPMKDHVYNFPLTVYVHPLTVSFCQGHSISSIILKMSIKQFLDTSYNNSPLYFDAFWYIANTEEF